MVCSLLEVAQTSLLNVMLLAVSYDIIPHFHGQFALFSCEINKYCTHALSKKKKSKEKQHHGIFKACIRLLGTCHLLEFTVYLRLSDYRPPTLSN